MPIHLSIHPHTCISKHSVYLPTAVIMEKCRFPILSLPVCKYAGIAINLGLIQPDVQLPVRGMELM